MKIAFYKTLDGKELKVEYDENTPCIVCGLPVGSASMGGTVVCPTCDCGVYRDGTEINVREFLKLDLLKKRAKEIEEEMKEFLKDIKENYGIKYEEL